MKIYISADIEGVTGVTNWNETEKNHPDWLSYSIQMSEEVNAASLAAFDAGAKEVIIKDAHDSGRNIDINRLPENVKLIRGWIGDPMSMISTIDESYTAIIFIGYHSPAGSIGNPLAHTMNNSKLNYIKINGDYASEFILHAYAAALYDVPVVFVSGDNELMTIVNKINPNIKCLTVKEGKGNGTINLHPNLVLRHTRESIIEALKEDLSIYKLTLPANFEIEICYKEHALAYRLSFYPGAEYVKPNIVKYNTNNYYDVMRLINFLI